ncbi:MAG TPA: CRTAC1 family protein [Pirellula sp.]|nr:CRTAC1 family protein [Pirellula sp.]
MNQPLRPLFCFKVALFLYCTFGSISEAPADDISAIRFSDYTKKSRIDFVHRDGSSGKHYLVETMAAGLASFDYDLDGDCDIFFLNGAALRGTTYETKPFCQLYQNQGNFEFRDVTNASGLGDGSFAMGIAIGDYDNDGFTDVYISNFGPNILYHNNGEGSFSPVGGSSLECARTIGGGAEKIGSGCCMLDCDGDGLLDIFAANYTSEVYKVPVPTFRERIIYGGPLLYPKTTDNLVRNQGDGTFTDISESSGIAAETEWGMGAICLDYDQDGDTDIFVANDSTSNYLWENDGTGKFSNIALLAGVAFDHRGDPQGNMGVDAADFDGDLFLDLHVTTYAKQYTLLFRHDQQGFYDATREAGTGANTFYEVNWGTCFADFDNDADKDIFNANGHVHDNMDDLDETVRYKNRNQVFENRWPKKFLDVSSQCGSGLKILECSRGAVADDFDLDGRIDLAVLNSRTSPSVLRNESINPGNWVYFDLVGTRCNRSGVGTRVVIHAGGKSQILEVHSGRSYQSHFGSRLHFGLGSTTMIEKIEIHWHVGEVETFSDLEINGFYVLRQGSEPIRIR